MSQKPESSHGEMRRNHKLTITVAGGAVVLCALSLFGCTRAAVSPERVVADLNTEPGDDNEWGVQVEGIRFTAAGYMLDFRYRVVDADKAKRFMGRKVRPYLIDQDTGAKVIVPAPGKLGALKQTSSVPVENKTYFVMFANPGRFIKQGNKVTVVIGDFEAHDIMVE